MNMIVRFLGLCAAIGLGLSGTAYAESSKARPAPPSLTDMDSNNDGSVSVAEADAFFASHGPGGRSGNRPDGPPPGGGADQHQPPPNDISNSSSDRRGPPPGDRPAPPSGAALDTNGDGQISDAEFASWEQNRPDGKPSR